MPITEEFLFRFKDSGSNIRDLQISQGTDGGWRLSVLEKGNTVPVYYIATAVAINTTENFFAPITTTQPSYFLGMYCNAETPGKVVLSFDGNPVLISKLDIFNKERTTMLPKSVYLPTGTVISATVNNSGIQAADYDLILFYMD